MIENKNRLIAIIILILVPVGIAFYVVWGILLNKGTVLFVGNPPYTVLIANEDRVCLETNCEISIPVGEHSYTILKDGHYDKVGLVDIERGVEKIVEVNLDYVVQILEGKSYNIFGLPTGYSKFKDSLLDVSLFHTFGSSKTLTRLPKIIENITFSPSGSMAIVFENEKVSIYDTEQAELNELEGVSDASAVAWAAEEKKIYVISFDEEAKKDALKHVNLENDYAIESLIYFLRDVDDYELSVSADEHYVAVIDSTFETRVVYILDLSEESRTNVFEGYLLKAVGWVADGSGFMFKGKDLDSDKEKLWFWNSEGGEVLQLPFEADNVAFSSNGNVFFTSDQPYNVRGSVSPYLLEFYERESDIDLSLLSDEPVMPENYILGEWDVNNNATYLVEDLVGKIEMVPEKIELSEDGKFIRMLINSNLIDIQLTE